MEQTYVFRREIGRLLPMMVHYHDGPNKIVIEIGSKQEFEDLMELVGGLTGFVQEVLDRKPDWMEEGE